MADLFNWTGVHPIGHVSDLFKCESALSAKRLLSKTSGPVRILGNRYSRDALLQSKGTLIDTSSMSGVINDTDVSIEVHAATPLHVVFDHLRARNKTLPCSPGVISEQTIAGALATGTHGQGMWQSALSDAVEMYTIIDAAGKEFEMQRDNEAFSAFQLSLGVLGLITQVKLRTVDNDLHRCTKITVSFDKLRECYRDWNKAYRFVKAWWFPHEGQVHVWLVNPAPHEDVAKYEQAVRQLIEHGAKSDVLNNAVWSSKNKMSEDTADPSMRGDRFRTVDRFADFCDVTGDVCQILCKGIPAKQINVEIAVPFDDKLEDVMDQIDTIVRREELHLHYPIILRSVGPSEAWLSPAFDRPTTYFGIVLYTDDAGVPNQAGLKAVRRIESLLRDCDGRPHWGKYFTQESYDWNELYPRLVDFRRLRRSIDPAGRFSNDYLRQLM